MIKKISLGLLMVLTLVSAIACQTTSEEIDMPAKYQKDIMRTTQFASELPQNYEIIDFRQRALAYDQLVYDFNKEGTYFPLIWEDAINDAYGVSAYVGDHRNGMNGSQEAVTSIAAVLSATLIGIDKSDQDGKNYVDALNVFFSEAEGVVTNNPGGISKNISMWYMIYPAILFTQVSLQYPDEITLRNNTLTTIESWYQAYLIMQATNSFDYTGFDFENMESYRNNIWREPDSAVGISMLMYYGYHMTADTKYKDAAITSLTYIDSIYSGSPMYEILLHFGPYLAALYNQEFDTSFDVNKMFNASFNGNSIPRGGWGMLNDNYNGFAVSGLIGSITDGGGYAFSMNSFASAFIIAKTAKYDTRYAASIGKWLNHLIANSRYFFPDYAKDENESMFNSEHASNAQAFNLIANNTFPYEGIRKSGNSKSPWFGGDPTVYGWAETDFSIYSGASMGMLASLYEQTNVEGILKIDLNAGDYFNQTYPTYLLYNPHEENSQVTYVVQGNNVDLYDAVTEKIIAENVSGSTAISIASKDAVVIVEIPNDSDIEKHPNSTSSNGITISSSQVSLSVVNRQNNDSVPSNFLLKLDAFISNQNDEIDYYEVVIDGVAVTSESPEITISAAPGSKTIIIRVYTKNGLKDQITLRLQLT